MLRLHKIGLYLRDVTPRRLLRCNLLSIVFFGLCALATILVGHIISNNKERQMAFSTRTQCTGQSSPISRKVTLEHEMLGIIPGDDQASTWIEDQVWQNLPVKGAFYMLAEISDLQYARSSMRSIEDRFNHQYGYPWVILSSRYITPEFRKYITMVTDAPVYFGKIDLEAWEQPHWVAVDLAERAMQSLESQGVTHGSSLSFRRRARYVIQKRSPELGLLFTFSFV